MPLMLAGKLFRGRFLFDGDSMLDHEVEVSGSVSNGTDVSRLAHPPSSGDFGEAGASRSA